MLGEGLVRTLAKKKMRKIENLQGAKGLKFGCQLRPAQPCTTIYELETNNNRIYPYPYDED